jgi:hypothetical protein
MMHEGHAADEAHEGELPFMSFIRFTSFMNQKIDLTLSAAIDSNPPGRTPR